MNKQEIPLMFCFDNNYVIPAAVAFYSLLEHANKNYKYTMYVLHTDISYANQEKLQETIKPFSDFAELIFVNMENRFEDLWKTIETKGHFSKEVMYKVLVASIFPKYDKIIVSDVDVVFLNDISQSYFDLDVSEDYYLAGVKLIGKMQWYMDRYLKTFTKEEVEKLSGFCGGYIVFNLKKLREDNMEEKFIKCFETEGYRINQMEQDVLNLCCYPKTKRLALKYVACSYMWDEYKTEEDMNTDSVYSKEDIEDAMNNTVQLHYATSRKPWKNVDCTKSEIWFEYLMKTNFVEEYFKKLPESIVLPSDRVKKIEDKTEERVKEEVKDDMLENYTVRKRIIAKLSLRQNKIFRLLRYFIERPTFLFEANFYKGIYLKIVNKIKKQNYTILIVDNVFPSFYSPFRTEEFMDYFKEFKNVYCLSTWKAIPEEDPNTGDELIEKFEQRCPEYKGRIINIEDENYIDKINKLKNKLAVLTLLENVTEQLEFLENNKIPFVFTLYPGGGFSLSNNKIKNDLKKVFSSKYFKKVIVNNKEIEKYLLDNNLCNKKQIKRISGMITPKEMFKVRNRCKKHYMENKNTLDICFADYEYFSTDGDDGFKIFVEVAKILKEYKNIKFHVVGKRTPDDFDIRDIRKNMKFYGVKIPEWFIKFYKNIDIVVSPNKVDELSENVPNDLCTQAMLNQVLVMCTDTKNTSTDFEDKKDYIRIKIEAKDIAEKIEKLYKQPKEIMEIAKRGQKKAYKNYCYETQMYPRYNLIRKIASKRR